MTDQELIQLLQEKPPNEFSPEELEALRDRWTQSPELRQALIDHLQLESQLNAGLGQIDLNIDAILQRAARERRQRPGGVPIWKWALGLVVLLGVGLTLFYLSGRNQNPENLVQDEPQKPAPVELDGGPSVSAVDNGLNLDEPADALKAVTAGQPTAPVATVNPVAGDPVAVPVVAEDEPWTKGLARDIAPWPANSTRFTQDFKGAGHDELSEVEARRWFSQVEGQPYQWGQDAYGQQQRRVARFHGLARLRAPWPEDAMLRLTPFDVTDLTIYFWRGPTGLALRFYSRRDPHTWAAFEVTRETSSPKPIRWGLLTTDNAAYTRGGTGTFDLRYQENGITLARGGIPLLTAPLAGPPDEVFIEGQFRLRGISIHRTFPLARLPDNPHPIVVGGPAANLGWAASAETPAELIPQPDGSVQFTADSRDKLGTVVVPLASRGLYEVIARVESADPGTGIFLGDLDGRPVHRVGYFKDGSTGRTTFGILRPGENRDQSNFDFNAFPPPYHTSVQWVKIVAGLGTVQILVSGDGRQWGHLTEDPARDLPGAVGSVGVYGLPGPARSLRLAHLEVRTLSGLTGLADPQLVAQAPQFLQTEQRESPRWSHRVIDTRPEGVELPRWFSACAVASLSQGPPRDFGVTMLKRLIAVAMQSDVPVDQKLLILDEAGLLYDTWEENQALALAACFDVLSTQMAAAGDPHPLATLRPAILRSSMWTYSKLRQAWERLASRELVHCAYRGDWPDAWRCSQSMSFWNANPHPDWVPVDKADILSRQARWLRATAVENAPQLDDGQAAVIPSNWRHPLALQWNKEAYNVRAELQSALSGQTYEDACRIVMSIDVGDGQGLLPDMDDRQLFVSLPTAVAAAMQVHPEFGKLMTEKFGPLGVIRVRQAVQSGNVRGVQAATLQFFGTEAAAEAHQWLGDRDLSAGRFPSAEEHFLLGLAHCLPRQREGLQSRLQLALALNGKSARETFQAPETPLEVNGAKITGAELASLVNSLAERPSPLRRFQRPVTGPTPEIAPQSYRVETRASFDGQPGLNPGRYEFRFGDPFGKQLALVADDKRIYLSNRLQVNAYALPGGQQQWAQGLGSEQGEAHGMPFTPMPPLVAGDRLFVRRLGKGGAELACLNAENGQVVWQQRPGLQVLSDPVFWNGSLLAMTLAKIDDDLVQVEGTRFDLETGAPTSAQPLFRLRDSADRNSAAQLTVAGRLAVCSMAGISACFDASGEIHWIRRHLWLPKSVDELSEDFRVCAPVLQGDRVIVAVPGVRAISCMDLETGRQNWTRALTDLQGILAVHGDLVIVETRTGLSALAVNDGHLIWEHPLQTLLESFQVNDRFLVVTQRVTVEQNKTRPYLVWLDLRTGREMAQSQIAGIERQEVQLGPLAFAAGKWWVLGGQGWKEAKRDLMELGIASTDVPGPISQQTFGGWNADLTVAQLDDLALVLPGWSPEANYGTRLKMPAGELRGQPMVLTAKVDSTHEVRLLQEVAVPAGRKTTLQLKVGNHPDRRWKLEIRAENQVLLDQIVEDAGSSGGWRDIVVDLTSFAGTQIPVQLIQSVPPQQPETEALWKRAAVTIE